MDSDDSQPGSSTSESSSNSSKKKSPSHVAETSPASSQRSQHSGRSDSRYNDSQNSRSKSKSDSDTSSNSSLSDDNEDDETNNANHNKESEASECVTNIRDKTDISISPSVMSRRSSRESSVSSKRSRSISPDRQQGNSELNISHEDLSDVSDLESEQKTLVYNIKSKVQDLDVVEKEDEFEDNENNITDLRQKLEKKKYHLNEKCETPPREDEIIVKGNVEESLEDLVKPHDEDALDFEAEEGECPEASNIDGKQDVQNENDKKEEKVNLAINDEKDLEDLEEGEVSDEDDKRPEETEPKPVCRFYTRGQCTWGMSCRFLHPGVTDKGNYTMFDLVRPVPLPPSGNSAGNSRSTYSIHATDFHDYRNERPAIHHRSSSLHHNTGVYASNHENRKVALDGPVVVESAWERGLRTAKEMMRKANKRKEQDMDFEDKKMNLTLSPDELEKDPYYLKDRLSPSENARHPLYAETSTDVYNAGDRYGRGPPLSHYDDVDPYGRSTRYRELPPHRMPHYEDERRIRPTREVIVQRVESVGRSDDWNDPWMRSKSPNGRGGSRDQAEKRRRRSYSSNSSYSSSSSSQSDSSSDSSGSISSRDRHRRRYNSTSHKTSSPVSRRGGGRNLRSLTPSSRRQRGGSPSSRLSPNIKRRTNVPSPLYNRGSAYSPVHKRKKGSPLSKKIRNEKNKVKLRHSSSSSDSDSTASESESETGSSSESSSQSRENTPPKRQRISDRLLPNEKKGLKKDLPKKRSPISIELKKPTTVGVSALTSPSQATSTEKDSKKSRREELLKQLRAVEDAIAKKRSKLA